MKTSRRLWMPVLLALVFTVGFGSTAAYMDTANAEETGEKNWQFHDIVDVAFLQPYAVVPQPEGVMIVDSRPYKPKYINGHIPTAVNIPDSQFEKKADLLPEDKGALLIFYCQGPT